MDKNNFLIAKHTLNEDELASIFFYSPKNRKIWIANSKTLDGLFPLGLHPQKAVTLVP